MAHGGYTRPETSHFYCCTACITAAWYPLSPPSTSVGCLILGQISIESSTVLGESSIWQLLGSILWMQVLWSWWWWVAIIMSTSSRSNLDLGVNELELVVPVQNCTRDKVLPDLWPWCPIYCLEQHKLSWVQGKSFPSAQSLFPFERPAYKSGRGTDSGASNCTTNTKAAVLAAPD